ncbi:MAG: hypothetical protein CM15mP74_31760 [Halieaceae bacterium]|nr:MAG: hypothetical protein CM15mP74_31760 [Halieaceae bacterium]
MKVLAWYDNEWGFSNRMLDTASPWPDDAEAESGCRCLSDPKPVSTLGAMPLFPVTGVSGQPLRRPPAVKTPAPKNADTGWAAGQDSVPPAQDRPLCFSHDVHHPAFSVLQTPP